MVGDFSIWTELGFTGNPYDQRHLPGSEEGAALFHGRERERHRVQMGLGSGGSHVLIVGEAGVGKTSLAQVAAFDMFRRGRDAGAGTLFVPVAASMHDPFFPEPSKGREAIKNVEKAVLRAFPDMQWRQLRRAIDVGDRVAVELAVNAVNDGPLEMPGGEVPATGRAISFESGTFWLIGPDGLITEERSYFDATGVATQLGITS